MIRKAKALIWGLVIFCATAVSAPAAHAAVSVDTAPRIAVKAAASGPLYLCEKYFQNYGWKRIYTRDLSLVGYYGSWWGGGYSCYCVAG